LRDLVLGLCELVGFFVADLAGFSVMFSALLLVDRGPRVAAVDLDTKIDPATCAHGADTFDVTAADPP
jgi:hypothetical protein